MATDGLQTFELFSSLPKEVRLRIWDDVCSVERVLPILPGKGHLSPITHRHLAVPPPLHVCGESRAIALKHYDLRFHPKVYTNPRRDIPMLHIAFPYERIDWMLYMEPAKFDWSVLPRLAVFLDDISFLSDRGPNGPTNYEALLALPPGLFKRQWFGGVTRPEHLLPFADDFLGSLTGIPYDETSGMKGPAELVILVLPPLTSRPNPVAQRIELVDVPGGSPAMEGLRDAEAFYAGELQDRVRELAWKDSRRGEWVLPSVRVRHATCTPWEQPPDPFAALGEKERWAEVEPETRRPAPAEDEDKPVPDEELEWQAHGELDVGGKIERERRQLALPYFYDEGLGPHVQWRRFMLWFGTLRMRSPYSYNGSRVVLWRKELAAEQRNLYDRTPALRTLKLNGLG